MSANFCSFVLLFFCSLVALVKGRYYNIELNIDPQNEVAQSSPRIRGATHQVGNAGENYIKRGNNNLEDVDELACSSPWISGVHKLTVAHS